MPTDLGTIKDATDYLQYLQAYIIVIPAYRVDEFINDIINITTLWLPFPAYPVFEESSTQSALHHPMLTTELLMLSRLKAPARKCVPKSASANTANVRRGVPLDPSMMVDDGTIDNENAPALAKLASPAKALITHTDFIMYLQTHSLACEIIKSN